MSHSHACHPHGYLCTYIYYVFLYHLIPQFIYTHIITILHSVILCLIVLQDILTIYILYYKVFKLIFGKYLGVYNT